MMCFAWRPALFLQGTVLAIGQPLALTGPAAASIKMQIQVGQSTAVDAIWNILNKAEELLGSKPMAVAHATQLVLALWQVQCYNCCIHFSRVLIAYRQD